MSKIRWGILGTAKIATQKVIPGMQRARHCEVAAIASRDAESARQTAARLGIEKAYGSYEELLADAEVDAVYIPLPNHLHVPWSLRALEAGKHVLCEKPISITLSEARRLRDEAGRYPRLKIMEAFMYRFHPQWQLARRLVAEGEIGELRTVQTFFAYFLDDPANIRNNAEIGGGALLDIGCYAISLSRFLFDAEPEQVLGTMEHDPRFNTDRLVSAVLEFPSGTSTFTCATQVAPYQRVNIAGTLGRVEIEIPFNAPPDRPCVVWHQDADGTRTVELETADQYTIQADLFARSILEDTPVPTPLDDAVANMRVIEAVVESSRSRGWVRV